ncbi:MAG: hypothetical protein AAFR62_05705 [Cyanobacteria bacterium J06629_2]
MLAVEKIGIRNLKAKLSKYVNSDKPIAVNKNGITVEFFYLPVNNGEPEIAWVLWQANFQLQEWRKPEL